MDLEPSDPLDIGLACVRPGFPFPIDENLWLIHTSPKDNGGKITHQNALLVKNKDIFLLINAPKLDAVAFDALRNLIQYEEAELRYLVLPTQGLKSAVKLWQKHFPEIEVYLSTVDGICDSKELKKGAYYGLNERSEKEVPWTNFLEFIPVSGLVSPEISLYHPTTCTLFIAEHLYPSSTSENATVASFYLSNSSEGNIDPRQVVASKLAAKSFSTIQNIPVIKRLVFSHKSTSEGCIYTGSDIKSKLRDAYEKIIDS
mmetsp:Transcript_2679/g.3049  ORF Transcript_2679/g.3049 Transcript_2679/m.3049 type:complete len:258 (-) Transcript_2679:2127-2900(-)